MAIMLESLYDALRAANVPDDKARAAAREVAEFHNSRAHRNDGLLAADIKSTQRLHTWILGVNSGMVLVLVGKAFL